jgi:putative ABC transport system permease protein
MSWLDGMRSVARGLFRRGAEERDLGEEIEFHLEMEAEKLVRQGWDAEAARRQALLRFGGVDRMKERTRDERGARWLEDSWADVRYAVRTLRRSPAFTGTAVLTLGLGIGATTAAFTLVDGVLLRPLPYAEPSELVELRELGEGRRFFPSFPNFQDWRRDNRTLDGMIAVRPPVGPIPLLDAGEPTMASALGVTRDFLSVLGVAPFLGRDFTSDENAPGGDDVALVSHALWASRLGSETDLERLGFTLFGRGYRVVGVLPPGFRFLYDADVYYPDERYPNTARASHAHRVVGRLADGVTLEDAKADLDRLAAAIGEAYPGESQAETVQVRPLADVLVGSHRRPLGLLLGASGLVLLLACANVASTLLARGSTREVEMGVRASLGAGRGRMVRQLFTEALVLAFLGAVLGAVVAYGVIAVAATAGGDVLPRLGEVSVGLRSLAVAVGVSAATAILFGSYPAARFAMVGAPGWSRSARGGSEQRGRVWDALLAGEAAFAVVLLVGAGLLLQSLMTIVRQDVGWSAAGVVEMSVTFPGSVFSSTEEAMSTAARVREELKTIPGVEAVGVGTFGPLDAGFMTAPARDAGEEPRLDNYTGWRLVDGDYFRALDIRLIRGRLLEPDDVHQGIVNESLARLLWGDEDPIGKRVVSNYDQSEPIEVVGVVADARDWRWERGSQTELYVPWQSRPAHIQGPLRYMIRTAGDPAAVVTPARERLLAVNPNLPADFETLRATLGSSVADRRFVASVLLAFAGTGLVLALIGVFGVVAYTVERRRREIGIRLALGAESTRIRRDVRVRALRAVGLGVAVGSIGALAGGRLVEALLYEVEPRDPVTLGCVIVLFLGTTVLASELPARRASRVAPASVLKE